MMLRVGGHNRRAAYTHIQTKQLLLCYCEFPWHEYGTVKVAPCWDSTPRTSPAFLPFLALNDSVDGGKHQEQSQCFRLTIPCLAHHRSLLYEAT